MNTKDSQFSFLLQGVYSDRQLISLVETLKTIQQKVLKSEDKKHLTTLPHDIFAAWPEPTRSETVAQQLEAASTFLESVLVTAIQLAYQPSHDQLKKIATFLRSRVQPELVLQVSVNSDLGAGFILQYQGKRVEYSLSSIINQSYS